MSCVTNVYKNKIVYYHSRTSEQGTQKQLITQLICAHTFAVTVIGLVFLQAAILRRAGITNRLKVTVADTGLPGNANTNLVHPSLSTVANVVGLLGV